MNCDVCGSRMSSWNEESWGRVEKVYECSNPNCGIEDESEDDE